jgi:hypothetical protein
MTQEMILQTGQRKLSRNQLIKKVVNFAPKASSKRYFSSLTQIFRKLTGSLWSPCACSLIGALSYFL